MANKQSAANSMTRTLLTFIGEQRDLEVLGLTPGQLQGKKIRKSLMDEFNSTCAYCGATLADAEMEIDHVVPMNKSSVGLHMYGNLVPSCKPCNKAKHSSSLHDFAVSHPDRVSAASFAKIQARAVRHGADLDTQPLRAFIEAFYASMGPLIEEKKAEAIALLPGPAQIVEETRLEIQKKSGYDFTEFAKLFPLGATVRAKLDGKEGVVVDYALEGDIGKKNPYVRFLHEPTGKKITRSPNQLEVIRVS
jgi:5-methylcytosine-specific restriction endonuclease McrA